MTPQDHAAQFQSKRKSLQLFAPKSKPFIALRSQIKFDTETQSHNNDLFFVSHCLLRDLVEWLTFHSRRDDWNRWKITIDCTTNSNITFSWTTKAWAQNTCHSPFLLFFGCFFNSPFRIFYLLLDFTFHCLLSTQHRRCPLKMNDSPLVENHTAFPTWCVLKSKVFYLSLSSSIWLTSNSFKALGCHEVEQLPCRRTNDSVCKVELWQPSN